jgi:Periplasmic binding protein
LKTRENKSLAGRSGRGIKRLQFPHGLEAEGRGGARRWARSPCLWPPRAARNGPRLGHLCYPEPLARRSRAASANDRIVGDPQEFVRRAPDIIIGSWCDKRFRPEQVKARGGWDAIPAVRTGYVYDIRRSADILQPGPVALGDGLAQSCRIIRRWAEETRP